MRHLKQFPPRAHILVRDPDNKYNYVNSTLQTIVSVTEEIERYAGDRLGLCLFCRDRSLSR